ncbi:MAG: SCO6880 family protein, partial [Nakamurella sp.]
MSTGFGPVRYGAWSKDRQGWFMGLGGGAWLVILLGGIPLLLAIGGHAWLLAFVWLPVWALLIFLVAVPVRGRSAYRWAVDSLTRCVGLVMRWTDWQSKAAAGTVEKFDEADLPGVLSGIRTHDGPPFGPLLARPAIVADNRERTWAAVARITHPGIGLSEVAARTRMGNGLSELLEGAATGELVSLVALQVRTVPDDGAERTAWQHTNLRRDAPQLALVVDAELSQIMVQAGVRHEAFITVVVPEHRIVKQAKEAGGGVDGRARVMYGVMGEIEARLMGPVGCTTATWLDSPALAAAIRTGFAPADRAVLTSAAIAAQSDPTVAGALSMATGREKPKPTPQHHRSTPQHQ